MIRPISTQVVLVLLGSWNSNVWISYCMTWFFILFFCFDRSIVWLDESVFIELDPYARFKHYERCFPSAYFLGFSWPCYFFFFRRSYVGNIAYFHEMEKQLQQVLTFSWLSLNYVISVGSRNEKVLLVCYGG